MTDPNSAEHVEQVKADVVDKSVAQARDSRAHTLFPIGMAVMLAGIVGLAATLWWTTSTQHTQIVELQQQAVSSSVQAHQFSDDSHRLADQVRSLGATPVVSPSAVGPVGPVGPIGATGATGAAGRGIAATQLVAGHLVATFTDGQSTDLGVVAGKDGAAGTPGRSITATSLTNGHLVVAYSDNTSTDVGAVVGKDGAAGKDGTPGRGVSSVTINSDSHLIVTYTDGSTVDAGQLPPGPAGPTGQPGPPGPPGAKGDRGSPPSSWTWTDELGRQQTCTRSGGTDASPTYTCTTQSPLKTK